MKRERATELLEGALSRLLESDGWPGSLVDAVYVFGSYSRGALEPGDVDLAVDLDRDDPRWRTHFLTCFSYGRNPNAVVAQLLRGRRRGLQFVFEREQGHDHVPMTLLWRRGETLDVALGRVRAIGVDAGAGRAARDFMIPAFDDLDHWLPRHVRAELVQLVDAEILDIEQIVLADRKIEAPWAAEFVDSRWGLASPVRRAAHAAIAHLEARGIDPATVHLQGRDIDIDQDVTPHFVGIELRHFPAMLACFDTDGGLEWIEVVHPTRRQPLRALRVRRGRHFAAGASRTGPGGYFTLTAPATHQYAGDADDLVAAAAESSSEARRRHSGT